MRTDLQFDDAHIPAAVCIPSLQAGFGTRLAWITDREQDVVLLGRDDEDARHAAKLALAVGIRRLGGFLAGGMTSWRQEKRPVERIERLPLENLSERSKSDPELQIRDVREQSERDAGYIPGSLFAPWHDIHDLPDGLDPERPVAVMCASGSRAAVASSLLQRHGAREVIHVIEGGVPKWERLGEPVERPGAGGLRGRSAPMTQESVLRTKVVEQLQALHALKAGALRTFDAILADVKKDHAARTLPSVDDLLEKMIGAFGGHAEETREHERRLRSRLEALGTGGDTETEELARSVREEDEAMAATIRRNFENVLSLMLAGAGLDPQRGESD